VSYLYIYLYTWFTFGRKLTLPFSIIVCNAPLFGARQQMNASRLLSLNKSPMSFILSKDVLTTCLMQSASSGNLDVVVGANVVPTSL